MFVLVHKSRLARIADIVLIVQFTLEAVVRSFCKEL